MRVIAEETDRAIAHLILEECGITGPPVDVMAICQYLGIAVRKYSFAASNGRRRRTADAIAGFYWRGCLYPVIGVNAYDSMTRRRFTIAHEIGEALLGNPSQSFDITSYSSQSRHERRMNAFAAELLMQQAWVARYVESLQVGCMPFLDLCRIFQVSKRAMSVRLEDLGVSERRPAQLPL